jgi:hypothetical protein
MFLLRFSSSCISFLKPATFSYSWKIAELALNNNHSLTCFSAKHAALRKKGRDCWLGIRTMYPRRVTSVPRNYCFSELVLRVLRGKATNTNFNVFGLTRPGLEPIIYSTRGEHVQIEIGCQIFKYLYLWKITQLFLPLNCVRACIFLFIFWKKIHTNYLHGAGEICICARTCFYIVCCIWLTFLF